MTTTHPRPVTQADIDHAREALERANFKLGKARSRSIMSTAQAAADAQDLQACVDAAAKAENEFAGLAERFVAPPQGEIEAAFPMRMASAPERPIDQIATDARSPVNLDAEPLHDAFRQEG